MYKECAARDSARSPVETQQICFFFPFFLPGDVSDSQVQPVNHTCNSSAPLFLKERAPAHRRQIVAESDGNRYTEGVSVLSVERV